MGRPVVDILGAAVPTFTSATCMATSAGPCVLTAVHPIIFVRSGVYRDKELCLKPRWKRYLSVVVNQVPSHLRNR